MMTTVQRTSKKWSGDFEDDILYDRMVPVPVRTTATAAPLSPENESGCLLAAETRRNTLLNCALVAPEYPPTSSSYNPRSPSYSLSDGHFRPVTPPPPVSPPVLAKKEKKEVSIKDDDVEDYILDTDTDTDDEHHTEVVTQLGGKDIEHHDPEVTPKEEQEEKQKKRKAPVVARVLPARMREHPKRLVNGQ